MTHPVERTNSAGASSTVTVPFHELLPDLCPLKSVPIIALKVPWFFEKMMDESTNPRPISGLFAAMS